MLRNHIATSLPSRARGALLGLAIGDALGTTLEFKKPGTFEPLTDIVGGGPFNLRPGQWTDDTSMALCLGESLMACGGFDPIDQMRRYIRWYREGHMSPTGRCFDIGNTVRASLERFERNGDPWAGSSDPHTAGNGSLMRLAPVPIFYAHDAREAISRAADSSKTTHGAAQAVDACRYFAGLLVGAMHGVPKEQLLSERYAPIAGLWNREPLDPAIDAVACGSFKRREPPAIRGAGYVVASLEAAMWAFNKSSDFRSGALLAANLGDDADTTAAIYGQIAGAHYGDEKIPREWRELVHDADLITSLAERLVSDRG